MSGNARVASLSQPGGPGLAAPLGLRPAARIQERDWDEFLVNPTQLANGCRDLVDAVGPDAIVVTSVSVLLEQSADGGSLAETAHLVAAVDAVARLAASLGGRAAVAAALPGPVALAAATGVNVDAAVDQILDAARALLASGADLLLVDEPTPTESVSLTTLINIARFHQAHVVAIGPEWSALPTATVSLVDSPQAGSGLVVTHGELPRDTDLGLLEDWVIGVAG